MAKLYFNLLLFLWIVVLPGLLFADEEREYYARQYINTMGYSAIYDEFKRKCHASAKNVTPEVMLKSNPNAFYGITPESRYWSEVIEIFESYYSEACDYMTTAEFINIFVDEYAKTLTVSELKKASAFYQTTLGIKLRDTHILANSTFQSVATKKSAENNEKVYKHFMKKLENLGRRYKKNQK